MQLIKFASYDEYVAAQTEKNKRKLECIWATRKDIDTVASYIRKNIPNPSFGICHGVRNGWEVKQFRSRLKGAEVIGTEISETATLFEHVIQWDFHEVKDEWIGNTDFIYSNSWDHSYNPEYCLDRWMLCLKPTGRCFIEWSTAANESNTSIVDADCFSATSQEYEEIISKKYDIEAVLDIPGSRYKRLIKKWKLTRVVSIGMPKIIFVIKRRAS